ncbi:MAG: HAMP domain-containing protein [Gammaproteobacteria bacterium]|nr:MAG: HAMP domain-containing protein [Gammaproteobacteria bacterium]
MSVKFRIPITAITVFGTSSLLAFTVGIVMFLGFGQVVDTTSQLLAEKSEGLIDTMEQSLDTRLQPIRAQALWIARDIDDLSNPQALDDYMLGALAATPQVAGIAVIGADGKSRRWHRDSREAIDEDWSNRPWIREYLEQVDQADTPTWRDPIFTETVSMSTLLHDVALRDAGGRFIGAFAQIVPIREISRPLSRDYSDTGITPFVLYNRNFVLAHPQIFDGSEQQPLPPLDEFGDLVLKRIWSPDEEAAFISRSLTDTQASGIFWGDDFYLYLYRNIDRYGPAPWTIGAYVNTSLRTNEQTERAIRALTAGLIVLVLAVIASIVVGRKVSSPVKAIVRAAGDVDAGELDNIEDLHGSRIRELDDAGYAFNKMVHGLRERKLIRDTLGRFVPEKVASSLLAGGGQLEVQQTEATVLFCDIESFTQLTESLGPVKIVEVLNAYFSAMVDILEQHGGVVTQFQGDAILATFNVPLADSEHARNAVMAAQDMLTAVAGSEYAGERLNIRIGINTGPVIAGAIGAKGRLNYTVHGDAVNLAARLEAMNKEYGTRLLLSESVAAQLGDSKLEAVGETAVRGQSRSIKIYTLAELAETQATGQ